MIRLLVVDDSALMRRLLGNAFDAAGDFTLAFARNGEEALAQLTEFRPDVITLDVNMPLMDGLTCLDRIMVERPCPVVMVSSLTEAGAEITLEAMQRGAVDFLPKPEGTISLSIDALAPILIEKVRTAAKAKLHPALRLSDRIRRVTGTPGRGRASSHQSGLPFEKPSVMLDLQRKGPVDGIVLVGTSTGGPPALDALLSPLPTEFPWPIIVAQHMPASFTGSLAKRLDRLCALTVVETGRPTPIKPGHVYIAKGDADTIIGARPNGLVVMAAPALAEHRWHPSVDRLVASALQHVDASRLIGVLMTGMGSDGAESMTRLAAAGGRTIAESEESAVVWGMPGELARAGGAQFILPVDEIAQQLMAWQP